MLTPAGETLLGHAARAFGEAARQALAAWLRGTAAGRLRLGTGATASIYLLPAVLDTVLAALDEGRAGSRPGRGSRARSRVAG